MLVVPWHPSSTLQLYRYYFNLDKLSCKLTGISWFLLSGSEPSVILKISKPLKTSGFLFTASSHFKPWRYPMCLSLSASFSTNWNKIFEKGNKQNAQCTYFISFQKKKRTECPYIWYITNFCYNFCSLSSTLQIGRVYGSWFGFSWQPMSDLISFTRFFYKNVIARHGTANNNQFLIAFCANEAYHKGLLSTNLI